MKWISVKDKLPTENGEYLVFCRCPEYSIEYICITSFHIYPNEHSRYMEKTYGLTNYPKKPVFAGFNLKEEMTKVTHWMELPQIPKDSDL